MRTMNNTKIGYFIISHGRPNEQLTYELFRSGGVELADIFIVCDDLDETLPKYIQNYGDRVIVFDKQKYMDMCDGGIQSPTGLHAVYARNAAYDMAVEKRYDFFVIADDDIKAIRHRVLRDGILKGFSVKEIDRCIHRCAEFMDVNKHIACIGFGTNNSYIGGANASIYKKGFDYLIANIGLYRADSRVNYASECQEDLIASILYNNTGHLMVAIPFMMVDAIVKGRNEGGIVGHYAEENTYYRYFGTLIYAPSSVKMAVKGKELIKSNKGNYYPMIISDRWKK